MSSSPGARSKTRSTSKNETECAARYEKRYSPQSATDATAAAAIATTPTTEKETPEARHPELLDKCQAPRCQRIDSNYVICYYNELGEKTTEEICWHCRNKYKKCRKYRGGTLASINKAREVDSEISNSGSDDNEVRE